MRRGHRDAPQASDQYADHLATRPPGTINLPDGYLVHAGREGSR